jgi:hypothetical protein
MVKKVYLAAVKTKCLSNTVNVSDGPITFSFNFLLSSFLGSTAQLRPWPLSQNPAEFLGGFSTIFFFTGQGC